MSELTLSAKVENYLKQNKELLIGSVSLEYAIFALSNTLKQAKHKKVVICKDNSQVNTLCNFYKDITGDNANVLSFPEYDTKPYDTNSPSPAIVASQMSVARFLTQDSFTLFTTPFALVRYLIPQSVISSQNIFVEQAGVINQEQFVQNLLSLGYEKQSLVVATGSFATRGYIVDVFPAGFTNPVRIEFFDDNVESIKFFSPYTQRTTEETKQIEISVCTNIVLNKQSIKKFTDNYYSNLGGGENYKDYIYRSIVSGSKAKGYENYLTLFEEKTFALLELLQGKDTIFIHTKDLKANLQEHLRDIEDSYNNRLSSYKISNKSSFNPLKKELLYLNEEKIESLLQSMLGVELSSFQLPEKENTFNASVKVIPSGLISSEKDLHSYLQDTASNKVIFVSCSQEDKASILSSFFKAHGYNFVNCYNDKNAISGNLSKNVIYITNLDIKGGFYTKDTLFLSENELNVISLLNSGVSKTVKSSSSKNKIYDASLLSKGDLVVHIKHGVGRFENLVHIKMDDDIVHDCLEIHYEGGDKLFLPIENIDLVTRYGSKGDTKLDSLKGQSWDKRKKQAQSKIQEIAYELVLTAAKRSTIQGDSLSINEEMYQEFAKDFKYIPTLDQVHAIEDIITDLQSGKNMDRLICGDVGFGKTEVALRAAFLVACAKFQVCIICPTTLLAMQHYEAFKARFEKFGLKVKMLSRIVSQSERNKIKEDLKNGDVNIVVGTHAVLADSVKFKNLKLAIIDEEQSFGVKDKEKIKAIRNNLHVLSMSATPIPRTLQMAMNSIKNLSLITTPPSNRQNVSSYVVPFDDLNIKEAIDRELARKGQVFFICNRIKHMSEIEHFLSKNFENPSYVKAHGQMPIKQIEDNMVAFKTGKVDILLATNIVESGIDISNANTMIIHNADNFGLAQLYQLKGRIGRSATKGYAYLTYQKNKSLNQLAVKRLEVIQSLDYLGASFALAKHDLDIRGAGNLLGKEQSGYIKEIGIELYQKFLEQAMKVVKEKTKDNNLIGKEDIKASSDEMEDFAVKVDLGVPATIPSHYVADTDLRMSLYLKFGRLENEEDVYNFKQELVDRFGKLPPELENLFNSFVVKIRCKALAISRLQISKKGFVVDFIANKVSNIQNLMAFVQDVRNFAKLRPDNSLFIAKSIKEGSEFEESLNVLNLLTKVDYL